MLKSHTYNSLTGQHLHLEATYIPAFNLHDVIILAQLVYRMHPSLANVSCRFFHGSLANTLPNGTSLEHSIRQLGCLNLETLDYQDQRLRNLLVCFISNLSNLAMGLS
ncbi:hypothetical protein FRC12_018989 [Ceratobasidium sp. 428]|nr:hypothetical protein FRC12_018989 [Ceratobasidium sp. 428]